MGHWMDEFFDVAPSCEIPITDTHHRHHVEHSPDEPQWTLAYGWCRRWQHYKYRRGYYYYYYYYYYSPEAVATARREIRSKAWFEASEVGRLRSVQTWCVASWCSIYRVDDASQTEEECCHLQHSRLRDQKSQKPLVEDGQRLQRGSHAYAYRSDRYDKLCSKLNK